MAEGTMRQQLARGALECKVHDPVARRGSGNQDLIEIHDRSFPAKCEAQKKRTDVDDARRS